MKKNLQERFINSWVDLNMELRENRILLELSFNEIIVINYIINAEHNGEEYVTTTELSKKMNLLKSQINAILLKLEKKDLITKNQNVIDKRVVEIKLTKKGRAIYEKEHERSLKIADNIIDLIGEEEVNNVINSFETVVKNIQNNRGSNEKVL